MDSDDERNDFFGDDDFDDEPALGGDDEAIEVPSDKDVLEKALAGKKGEKAPRKRIVQNPQPKLNEDTLIGPKGLRALVEIFQNYKPDKNRDPYYNLDVIMKKYENWSHVMFPRLKFDDIIARCEKLGSKGRVKVHLNRIRHGDDLDEYEDHRPTKKDALITTDNNDDEESNVPKKNKNVSTSLNMNIGVITSRNESDDDDFDEPVKPKPEKESLPPSQEEFDPFEMDLEPNEEDLRQFEREADEMMADFDY